MAEVYTKEEVNELLEKALAPLWKIIQQLEEAVGTEWINQKEAIRLTGRSRAWFYQHRHNPPIRTMLRTEGSRCNKYSRADCIRYAKENGTLPPTA